jgi:hypothetical protein
LIFSLLITKVIQGQTYLSSIEVGKHAHQFYDATKKAFVVIADSNSYYIYNEELERYEVKPLIFESDSTFQHILTHFHAVSTDSFGTFFIHRGCGVVYHFINDRLYRHDKSFYHKNQYGGAIFENDNEIYMFGGYGLFTEKNIITRYDRELREWFKVMNVNEPPEPIFKTITTTHEHTLIYLIGQKYSKDSTNSKVYSYCFQSHEWHQLGIVSENLFKKLKILFKKDDFNFNIGNFFVGSDFYLELDIPKNTYKLYALKNPGSIISVQRHPLHQDLMQVCEWRSGILSYSVKVLPKNKFLKNMVDTGSIWNPERKPVLNKWQVTIIITFMLGSLLTLLGFYISQRRTKRRKTSATVNFSTLPFERPDFIKLRALMLNSPDYTVAISDINELVEEDGLSAEATKKRRERLLKEFAIYVSQHFDLSPSEVFIELRHEKDKRIKLIKLNNVISKTM